VSTLSGQRRERGKEVTKLENREVQSAKKDTDAGAGRPATPAVVPPPAGPEPGLPPGAEVVRIQTPTPGQLAHDTKVIQQGFLTPPAPAEPRTNVTGPPAKGSCP
jgi:hypothetical protein